MRGHLSMDEWEHLADILVTEEGKIVIWDRKVNELGKSDINMALSLWSWIKKEQLSFMYLLFPPTVFSCMSIDMKDKTKGGAKGSWWYIQRSKIDAYLWTINWIRPEATTSRWYGQGKDWAEDWKTLDIEGLLGLDGRCKELETGGKSQKELQKIAIIEMQLLVMMSSRLRSWEWMVKLKRIEEFKNWENDPRVFGNNQD